VVEELISVFFSDVAFLHANVEGEKEGAFSGGSQAGGLSSFLPPGGFKAVFLGACTVRTGGPLCLP